MHVGAGNRNFIIGVHSICAIPPAECKWQWQGETPVPVHTASVMLTYDSFQDQRGAISVCRDPVRTRTLWVSPATGCVEASSVHIKWRLVPPQAQAPRGLHGISYTWSPRSSTSCRTSSRTCSAIAEPSISAMYLDSRCCRCTCHARSYCFFVAKYLPAHEHTPLWLHTHHDVFTVIHVTY